MDRKINFLNTSLRSDFKKHILNRNFDVLVIDEATSSMDNISEETIYNEIYKLKDKTVFIISHRLAFLKKCDLILEFNNGKIINSGNYDDLLSKSSSFKELAKNIK